MTKYIQVLGEVFESYLLFNLTYIKDEYLLDTRKNRVGNPKNNFYASREDSLIINNFEKLESLSKFLSDNKTTAESEKIPVKNYFSYANILNSYEAIELEKKKIGKEPELNFEQFKSLLPENPEKKSHFLISAKLGNAINKYINVAHWEEGKEFIWKILFSETKLFGYIFEFNDEICILWEFNQDSLQSVKNETTSKPDQSPLDKPENTIFYGSPGTGKSHKVNDKLKDLEKKYYERITFHPEYDHASFVGGYKPISEKNDDDIDEVKYKFVPQVFTNIYERAWKDQDNQYYLAIEEINRGNCAEIFGDIFQLLDRNSNYSVTPSSELQQHLQDQLGAEHDGIVNGLKLPNNLTIWATMNTSDQSLFPMDSAFKRRWNWEYIPICYDDTEENLSSKYFVEIETGVTFSWLKFIEAVNTKIKHNPNLGMDKCIGNYFIKPEDNKIELKEFINKAIFYLWNDVFKDEDERDSIFKRDNFYEDFFPIETNGKNLVLEILEADDFVSVEVSKSE